MEVLPKQPTSKGSSDIFVGDVWVDRVASGVATIAYPRELRPFRARRA